MDAWKVVLSEDVVVIGGTAEQAKAEVVRALTNDPSLLTRVLKVEGTSSPVVVLR